jgi:hypothetical protein
MARKRWVVAVLAISLAGACKKDKKEEGKGTTAEQSAPGAGKKAEAPKDDLSLIPVDAEMVIGVKASQLFGSPLWKQYVQPQMEKEKDFTDTLAKFKERCGYDPMTTVTDMVVGLKDLAGDMPNGVVVLHGLDKGKTMACVDKWSSDAEKEKITFKKDGDVVVAVDDTNAAVGFTFISGDRMLVVVGQGVNADAVRKAAVGGSTLSSSPAFVDMHGKIKTDDSTWFVLNGNSKALEEIQQLGIKPKAIFGSVHVTDAVSADVRARLDSPDQAKQTVSSFKGQVDAMASMFDKIALVDDGADVRLTAAASKEKLQSLFQLVAGGGM